jgi:hypothetical protein
MPCVNGSRTAEVGISSRSSAPCAASQRRRSGYTAQAPFCRSLRRHASLWRGGAPSELLSVGVEDTEASMVSPIRHGGGKRREPGKSAASRMANAPGITRSNANPKNGETCAARAPIACHPITIFAAGRVISVRQCCHFALASSCRSMAESMKYPKCATTVIGTYSKPDNGRQLADHAIRQRPALRVLFTTGYTANAIVHQGRLDPDVELISKPFTYDSLAHKIRPLLDATRS